MAEKIISPGVFTDEIDQTFLPAAVADIGGAVVGPTVKGPVLEPTIVTSYSEYQAIFGDVFQSGSIGTGYYTYLTSITAKEYLKNNDTLTVVRVLAGSYGGASVAISSSIDPNFIGNQTSASSTANTVGTQASGSIRIGQTRAGGLGNSTSSLNSSLKISSSDGSGRIEFVLTSSHHEYHPTSTSTVIYIRAGSGSNAAGKEDINVAQKFANVINNSGSTHGLPLSASAADNYTLGLTSSYGGSYTAAEVIGGAQGISGSMYFNTGSFLTASFGLTTYTTADGKDLTQQATASQYSSHYSLLTLVGGKNFNDTGQLTSSYKTPFKLHTLADGEIMNSGNGYGLNVGTNNLLKSGSKDNLRFEISNLNKKRGLFSLQIRRGNDTTNRKQILESWNNLTLDPNENNYIAKVIGDSYLAIQDSGKSQPYLKSFGTYLNKSKYVRVEVLNKTPNYLDVNGDISNNVFSASLPTFHSGSNSGSFGGSFSGGSDGTVQHPKQFYENIVAANNQGLDPTTAASGKTSYEDALNLLSNQDEYDINLLLLPGIIDSVHSSICSKAIDVCENRGDCFVILDPVPHNTTNIVTVTDEAATRNSNYAAMYWPWVQIADNAAGRNVWVPPSVAVAGVYAFNDRVAHEWFAPAGLNRGQISTARRAERNLTQTNRDDLYDSNVNPIATFPGQGVVVYGQKTLQKKSSALDRVNVRRLLIKLKKFIASSSRYLVFEQNTSATRKEFLSIVNPFMEQIQAQSGMTAFRVVMDETNNTPDTVDRNILYGQIFVQPTRTAEFVVLDFTIQPTGATFPE